MKTWNNVDKSSWGHGSWMSEADKAHWVDDATGLDCLIVRNHGGALCGYVGVPEGHPAFGKDYDSVDVGAHGGLTFAGGSREVTMERWEKWRNGVFSRADEAKQYPRGDTAQTIQERAKELESYEAYKAWAESAFIGHIPQPDRPAKVWWLGFDCAHYGDGCPAMDARIGTRDGEYRDFQYVKTEVESLAQQLVKLPA